jgi:hypothetical protein
MITGEKSSTTSETELHPDGTRTETFTANSAPLTSELVRSAPTPKI